jgi:glycosyltransferase involved in cell wall biosynthesis
MAGPAGALTDIRPEGALAAQLEALAAPGSLRERSRAARAHVERTFSEEAVLEQILQMYRETAGGAR